MTEVSERTRMPVETLRHWRKHGKGPAGFKVGRRVLYDEDAVDGWLREQMQTANGQ